MGEGRLTKGLILGAVFAALIVLGAFSSIGIKSAEALTAPTITAKQTFTNSGGAANFDRVWVNSTHALMLAQSGGSIYRYTYNFAADTIATSSLTISHGLRVCNQGFGVSSVQTDMSVFVVCKVSGTVNAVAAKYNVSATLTKISSANITLGGTSHIPLDTEISKTNIYTMFSFGASASLLGNMTKTFTGFTQTSAAVANSNIETDSGEGRIIVYSGSASASTDIVYYFGINTQLELSRFTVGSNTGNANCYATQTNTPMTVYPLYDRIIVIAAGATIEVMNTGTTCTTILPTTMAGRQIQGQTISNSAHDYSSTLQNVLMNSSQASGYVPSTSASDATYLYPETISTSGSEGTITGINEPKFYVLNEDHFVSATTLTGTSWTVKEVTNKSVDMDVTPYSEFLNVPLVENQTVVWVDLAHIICDVEYTMPNSKMYFDEADDCTIFRIIPTTSDTLGRIIPFDINADLVHVNPMTAYTVSLSAAAPDLYSLSTIYDGFTVDTAAFDSAGASLQFLLYGQCYTMQIIEETTENILQTGNICANDITTKTISLSGITIPSDWLGSTWSHVINRTYNNGTINDLLTFTYAKNVVPFNASLHVYDNILDTPTYDQWFNVTSASANVVVNVTGIYSNQTIYFDLYERDSDNATTIIIQDVSAAKDFTYGAEFDDLGLLFGIPAIGIFPIIVAFIFPKSIAYFGAIVTVAVIGVLVIFGFYTMPVWFWGLAIPLLAFAVFTGRRSPGGG